MPPGPRPALLVSIVVPALDEAAALPTCLAALRAQTPPFELLVVDGGSRDATVELAQRLGARVLAAPRGRGRQLAAGAAAARGDVLLFVHADTRLPPRALDRLRAAVARGRAAGAFTMRFDRPGPVWRLVEVIADAWCAATGNLFGDRAMFATRAAYEQVGGFRDLPLMEDLDLALRLRRAGVRLTMLRGPVVTSARRVAAVGLFPFIWRCYVLIRAFRRGAPLDPVAARTFLEGKRGPARLRNRLPEEAR
jgi:rSAM/selenodomain-associated transferase 2